ncbi:hypothetical protein BdWA1_002548 [Babesia duncani]|uniref:Uncharacterized protein n=1 Tax=Babesia duncani TaxID=323732 RepID=A0AAD9PJD1_9APIC|nr:hypothetical protein BdWA1_002548 [Babesia duncani]
MNPSDNVDTGSKGHESGLRGSTPPQPLQHRPNHDTKKPKANKNPSKFHCCKRHKDLKTASKVEGNGHRTLNISEQKTTCWVECTQQRFTGGNITLYTPIFYEDYKKLVEGHSPIWTSDNGEKLHGVLLLHSKDGDAMQIETIFNESKGYEYYMKSVEGWVKCPFKTFADGIYKHLNPVNLNMVTKTDGRFTTQSARYWVNERSTIVECPLKDIYLRVAVDTNVIWEHDEKKEICTRIIHRKNQGEEWLELSIIGEEGAKRIIFAKTESKWQKEKTAEHTYEPMPEEGDTTREHQDYGQGALSEAIEVEDSNSNNECEDIRTQIVLEESQPPSSTGSAQSVSLETSDPVVVSEDLHYSSSAESEESALIDTKAPSLYDSGELSDSETDESTTEVEKSGATEVMQPPSNKDTSVSPTKVVNPTQFQTTSGKEMPELHKEILERVITDESRTTLLTQRGEPKEVKEPIIVSNIQTPVLMEMPYKSPNAEVQTDPSTKAEKDSQMGKENVSSKDSALLIQRGTPKYYQKPRSGEEIPIQKAYGTMAYAIGTGIIAPPSTTGDGSEQPDETAIKEQDSKSKGPQSPDDKKKEDLKVDQKDSQKEEKKDDKKADQKDSQKEEKKDDKKADQKDSQKEEKKDDKKVDQKDVPEKEKKDDKKDPNKGEFAKMWLPISIIAAVPIFLIC